jgi:hypothetical protein
VPAQKSVEERGPRTRLSKSVQIPQSVRKQNKIKVNRWYVATEKLGISSKGFRMKYFSGLHMKIKKVSAKRFNSGFEE